MLDVQMLVTNILRSKEAAAHYFGIKKYESALKIFSEALKVEDGEREKFWNSQSALYEEMEGYPSLLDVFGSEIVYKVNKKYYRCSSKISDDNSVEFGDPTEVDLTYVDSTESASESFRSDVVLFQESAVGADGKVRIKIIEPGQGSSAYYPKETLKRDGPKIFVKGTQMFWDHPTESELQERPERSLRDLAGTLESDAEYLEQGPRGPGLYSWAHVLSHSGPL